jgi:predicted DNA-binding transcriptional regulator YafY
MPEAPLIVPEGFDLDHYIHEGKSSFPVGEPIRLEAVLSRGAAFHLHDAPLSADQQLADLDD